MTGIEAADIAGLVKPDKVHRRVFTDPDLFELEMERIFARRRHLAVVADIDPDPTRPGPTPCPREGRQ